MNPAEYAQRFVHTEHRVYWGARYEHGITSAMCAACRQRVYRSALTEGWRLWTVLIHEEP